MVVARNITTSSLGFSALPRPVETGDPTFDAAFRVEALDATRARTVLDGDVRQRLMKVAGTTARVLTNDAEILLAEERCVAPHELGSLIDGAVAIAFAVTPRTPGPPYR